MDKGFEVKLFGELSPAQKDMAFDLMSKVTFRGKSWSNSNDWERGFILNEANLPARKTFCALHNGKIVGFAHTEELPNGTAGGGFIGAHTSRTFVKEHTKTVGRLLAEYARQYFSSRGIRFIDFSPNSLAGMKAFSRIKKQKKDIPKVRPRNKRLI